MTPRALLIDFDRTLVDVQSHTDYRPAVDEIKRTFDGVEPVEVPETDWGSVTQEAMALLVALTDRPQAWQRASDILERQELAVLDQATAMTGLHEFLAVTARVPRSIVTLIGSNVLDAVCDRFDIDVPHRMSRRVGQAVKPAPDQMLAACEALSVSPSDAAMIGDSSWDEVGASAAGVRFVGITNGGPSVFEDGTETVTDLLAAASLLGFPQT